MKKILLSALILAAAAFAGCQNDKMPSASKPGIKGEYKTVYAHIKISNSDITRAANANDNVFEDGSSDENTVHNLLIVFYDQNMDAVGYYDDAAKDWEQEDDGDTGNDVESKLEWKEAEVVPITMHRPGEPFYAIAFLNYDEAWKDDLIAGDISTVSQTVKNTYTITDSNTKYFLMTNSGAFDSNNDYQIAQKIEGFVFPTASEAKNSPAITIYVERAAARVDLKIADDAAEVYEVYYGDDIYELTFTPEHWALTATETENYLLKNMQSTLSAYEDTEYPSGFSTWIDYSKHRTYWAETPKYSDYTYPESGIDTKTVSLDYVTYEELDEAEEVTGDEYSTVYTFEHTFGAADLNEASNAYAVPTSIVFDGAYTAAKKDGGEDLEFNDGGFYLRTIAGTKHIYLEINDESKDDLLIAYLKEQTVIYTKDEADGGDGEGEDTYTVVGEEAYEDFEIVNTHVFHYADGNEAESSNAWTLQLKSDASETYYLRTYVEAEGDPAQQDTYVPAHYTYTEISSNNLAAANTAIQKNVGSASKYASGKTYFYVPILHYIDSESYPDNNYTGTFATDDETDEITNKTGEFGIVRNHIYRLTINKIEGLGFGNPGDDETAFPLPDPEEDKVWYFHAKLEILSWHVIEFNFDLK